MPKFKIKVIRNGISTEYAVDADSLESAQEKALVESAREHVLDKGKTLAERLRDEFDEFVAGHSASIGCEYTGLWTRNIFCADPNLLAGFVERLKSKFRVETREIFLDNLRGVEVELPRIVYEWL